MGLATRRPVAQSVSVGRDHDQGRRNEGSAFILHNRGLLFHCSDQPLSTRPHIFPTLIMAPSMTRGTTAAAATLALLALLLCPTPGYAADA
jgi:hypothetical protein